MDDVFAIKDNKDRTLPELLRRDFPNVSMDNIRRILFARKSEFDNEDHAIFSFLNSSLDARVIDFVRRDSLHLGIKEGGAVDLEELLPHLTINNHKLALRITGVTVAEQIISLRYWLFNRIYWCRPNRSFVAMVRFLVMELLDDDRILQCMRDVVLRYTQRRFIRFLHEQTQHKGQPDLIDLASLLNREQQFLYPVAFDVSPAEAADLKPAWKRIEKMTHHELKGLGEELSRNTFSPSAGVSNGRIIPILVDLPQEPGSAKLGEDIMVIGHDKHSIGLTDISGIIRGVNDGFNNHLRRMRVFVHPSLYPDDPIDRRKLENGFRDYFLKHWT